MIWASLLVGATALGWMFYLETSYTATMPREPDPKAGRLVPVVINHGHHVFVSASEARTLDTAELYYKIVGPLVGLVLVVALADDLWSRRKRS